MISLEGIELITQWASEELILFEWSADLGLVDLSDPENPTARRYLSSESALRDLLVSPDGSLAAYRSNESGTDEIYIRSFPEPGAQTAVSQSGGAVPFWSPDGNTLYYWRNDGGGRGTFFAARLQREPQPVVLSTDSLFSVVSTQPFSGSSLHPDGDRWIVARLVRSGVTGPVDEGRPRLLMVTNFFEELKERMGN